jgi:hypothetical protein
MRQDRPGREIYVEQVENNLQVNGQIDEARGKEAEWDRKGGNERMGTRDREKKQLKINGTWGKAGERKG